MNKTFYINYSRLKDFNETQMPIGVVIDMHDFGSEELDNFINMFLSEEKTHMIKSVVIKTEIKADSVDKLMVNENIFYMFYNESEERVLIQSLPKDLQKQIIGMKVCRNGIDVVMYRMSGISRIQIGSPMLNSMSDLEMLVSTGWTLYATPNYNTSFGNMVDINWIRPEGINLYDGVIDNFFLASNSSMNINLIARAYVGGGYIGRIKDFIVNFDNDDNPYREQMNLLSPTFDVIKTVCGDDHTTPRTLIREFELSKKITG